MNDNISEEVSIEEIHQVQLELLKKIAKICDEQSLTYFLCWGTLIGAIRHNGFIPWDDDVDIVMLRPDYEKLIAYFKDHEESLSPIRLLHYSTSREYIYPIARVCDTRYRLVCDYEPDYGLGIFVDIYPLDGWGNTKEDASKYFKMFHSYRRDHNYAMKDHFPSFKGAKWRAIYKWPLYRRARLLGTNRISRNWDKRAMQLSPEEAKYVGNLNWAIEERERIKKTDLRPIKHRFEDAEFTIPYGYDRILRNYYGDYMRFPPEEEQIGHHLYTVFRVK